MRSQSDATPVRHVQLVNRSWTGPRPSHTPPPS
nr:hypothetical protein [Tsukamurella pseudospumae]